MITPADADIQTSPMHWIPAGAWMTFHLCLQGRLATFKMPHTLQGRGVEEQKT